MFRVPVGLTVSILIVLSLAELLLPALSLTEQLTVCVPWPDTETVYGLELPLAGAEAPPSTEHEGAAAMPLVASETVTETLTGWVTFQPFAPSGVCVTEIDGGVLSAVS